MNFITLRGTPNDIDPTFPTGVRCTFKQDTDNGMYVVNLNDVSPKTSDGHNVWGHARKP